MHTPASNYLRTLRKVTGYWERSVSEDTTTIKMMISIKPNKNKKKKIKKKEERASLHDKKNAVQDRAKWRSQSKKADLAFRSDRYLDANAKMMKIT